MAKTIIISNRLPIRVESTPNGSLKFVPSEGGLATGLGSVYKNGNNIWLGWTGYYPKTMKEQQQIEEHLKEENMRPVALTWEDVKLYYEGFSNTIIWPNFHYFPQYIEYNDRFWEAYKRVNKKFCDELLKYIEEDDTVWVHDYQLLLLPELIRAKHPRLSIGYFNHIPFPSYEMFRLLPWRKEILNGLLGADLIGFHTYDDMRHFLSSVSRLAAKSVKEQYVQNGDRVVLVDSFPMGIDYQKYASFAASPDTIAQEVLFRTSLQGKRVILSIDRLDYSKGIPQRLNAFELFLEKHPQFLNHVSLVMLVVPSREHVEKYKQIKEEIELLVGRINGRYSMMDWTPVHYFYRSLPMTKLSALYRIAEVALVTPMRDGMNLVCKEFIASKLDRTGVLILSEMAGSSKELSDAILINPNNINRMVEAMHLALTMPREEQIRRNEIMQKSLQRYNIHHWVDVFMTNLKKVKEEQQALEIRQLSESDVNSLTQEYQAAQQRLLLLDYDGTLMPFFPDPKDASPDEYLLEVLEKLAADPRNHVVIISGRGRQTLESWLGHLNISLIGEHGLWLKPIGGKWTKLKDVNSKWKKEIHPVLDSYVSRTPGSFIEEKDYSLVWHFRKVELGLGELRSRELTSHLKYMARDRHLQVLEGDMVVEIKNFEVNKGAATLRWMNQYPADFYLAIGDDWTDEDTFEALPESAFTVKVGVQNSKARFNVESVDDVRVLLGNFS
ncbi:MAG: bifunctional alpha,alpha-trehalose-phosphate synthase (UDP-forming)/trehalose-phosphatase [Bacteroidota bacterium]